jgi:hypothetical protein
MHQQLYLTVAKDGSFNLLPYLPDKKDFMDDTKIFELPELTTIKYIYELIERRNPNKIKMRSHNYE